MAAAVMQKFIYNPESAHEDFPEWKFLFENYLALQGIKKETTTSTNGGVPDATKALQNLIHAGDVLAVKLLRQFDDVSIVTYTQLMGAMDQYCAPKDIPALTFKFDTLKQKDGESVLNFILRLKPIAKSAGISNDNMNKELLRRIAVNTNSSAIRDKAMETDMTTEKLIAWETTKLAHQQCTLEEIKTESINFVKGQSGNKRKFGDQESANKKKSGKCGKCGYEYPHKDNKCPAEGKACSQCKRTGHFARMCRLGQPPNRGGANGQSTSGNGGSWNNTQQNNSNNKYNSKRVYQVKEEFPPTKGHPDYESFLKYCEWIGSDACQGGKEAQDPNNDPMYD